MPSKSILRCPSPIVEFARKSAGWITRRAWPLIPRSAYQNLSLQSLNVALTRRCNVDCVFCPYQLANKSELIHMPDDIFELVVQGIRETGIKVVMLSPDLGEPPMAPDFMRKVRALREAGIKLIQLTTNGSLLHRVGIEQLVSVDGPDLINISFPGFDREMYERVCRAKCYDKTRDNILELLRANDAQGHPKTITLRFRGDLPEAQLLAFPEVEEVTELADDVTVMTAVDDWIGQIKPDMLTGELHIQETRPKLTSRPCLIMFNVTIHPNGDLHLCSCRNIVNDPDLHIGNIRDMSLSEAYQRIFGVMKEWEERKIPGICRKCSMYADPANAVGGRFRRTISRKLFGKYYF